MTIQSVLKVFLFDLLRVLVIPLNLFGHVFRVVKDDCLATDLTNEPVQDGPNVDFACHRSGLQISRNRVFGLVAFAVLRTFRLVADLDSDDTADELGHPLRDVAEGSALQLRGLDDGGEVLRHHIPVGFADGGSHRTVEDFHAGLELFAELRGRRRGRFQHERNHLGLLVIRLHDFRLTDAEVVNGFRQ